MNINLCASNAQNLIQKDKRVKDQQSALNHEQRKYKAQIFMLGGLALHSPLGFPFINIYNILNAKDLDLTLVSVQILIGICLAIFGTNYFQKGLKLLEKIND